MDKAGLKPQPTSEFYQVLLLPRVRTGTVKHCFTRLQDKGYACVGGHNHERTPLVDLHISQALKSPVAKAIRAFIFIFGLVFHLWV
jgi:hypothetical protein